MMGFSMPAEWSPQKRIWMSWPHAKADWPGKFAPIPYVFAEMVRVITGSGQRVGLLVKDIKARAEATKILMDTGVDTDLVDMLEVKTNRGWLRDCGPIWARDGMGGFTALNWRFTGWAKYGNHKLDNDVPDQIADFTKDDTLEPTANDIPIVLEGGGIEVDGLGSIIVTEEWLLSDTQVRNKGFTREDYELLFEHYLGCPNTIWLGKGIVGDDTHGHVDDITRFVAPGKIVTVVEHDKKDENHALLQENLKRLKKAKDAKGRPFEIIELPMPRPVVYEGQRLPASYANFLICNKVVLVPVFNDVADKEALRILQECFPKREVVGIYAR
ncbi:MAG: agmatine deiminase family protein, partial [Proteobacteria bacterium]|nr:agmatine deiminase family protein [Pseudomonadota bacterium]